MLQAMLSGVASLKAQQTEMSVIGNNLANLNTTAYKSSSVSFEDLLSQTTRGALSPTSNSGGVNPEQFGLGVIVAGTSVNDAQGSLNATGNVSDLAIQGDGYFMVSNGQEISYTRDGGFTLDANGNMVQAATGQRLVGWTANPATGKVDTSQPVNPTSYITIPLGNQTAVQATTTVNWAGNLDSNAFTGGTTTAGATETVYDTLGASHNVSLNFQASATTPNTWTYTVTGTGGDTVTGGTGTVTFDPTTGQLKTGNPGTATITPGGNAAAPAFTMNLDFGQISQVGAASSLQAASQNGYAPGSLSSYTIGTDGTITGLYTNGLTRNLGEISSAIFPNSAGLSRTGNNLWQASNNSGVPVVGTPNSGGRGEINSGFLEQSNVDISSEFTNMIIAQRGFEANTKVISAVDELMQTVIQMKH